MPAPLVGQGMRHTVKSLLLPLALLLSGPSAEAAAVKEVARVYGVRDNSLFGYGLVTGLNRTGDSLMNEATIRAVANRLQGLGFTVSTDEIMARNVAVVMVTAQLPASGRPGQKLDVQVSSSGDAMSLRGGVLQLTLLNAPNGETFATAQGPLVLGGISAGQGGTSVQKNHPTTARVPQGAVVERENPNRFQVEKASTLDWIINKPDFTTGKRMKTAINDTFDEDIANVVDDTTLRVRVPSRYLDRVAEFISEVEQVDIKLEAPSRVVVNERTGTVVVGGKTQLGAVAIVQGDLQIEIQQVTGVSQPGALSTGTTAVTQNTGINVRESDGTSVQVEGVSVGDLVNALNQMGVKPQALIQILLALHANGALTADVIVQ